MKRDRATKIIGTLGPASNTPEIIEALFLKGVDVFRLNFSHGTWETHKACVAMIRDISKKYNRPIGIMQDLQGPKLRVGKFTQGKIDLQAQSSFTFYLKDRPGDLTGVSLPHPEIFQVIKPGMMLLLDDGRLKTLVEKVTATEIITTFQVGGVLSDNKGVNVPDIRLPISALTPKDREDLVFGQKLQVDFVALSFVQTPEDIHELRSLLTFPSKILAKLEKPAALDNLEAIIDAADGIIVARGDLGVEMPPEDVPCLQRRIIRACRAVARPVIVATQMLDSMMQRSVPTRAEASDVASAVYDAVDALMLSGESASGDYPIEAVQMMDRIIKKVEADPFYRETLEKTHIDNHTYPANAIAGAARQVAHTIEAKAIVTLTEKGDTALRVSYERPMVPVLALTPNGVTAQQLALVWGLQAYVVEHFSKSDQILEKANELLRLNYQAKDGDHIVMTWGVQISNQKDTSMFQKGTTRVLRVVTLGEDI